MTAATHPTLSPSDAQLWAAHGEAIAGPPAPFPSLFGVLPLCLADRTLPAPGPDGTRPQEAWLRTQVVRTANGPVYAVRVTGDPVLGLPRFDDYRVGLALMFFMEVSGYPNELQLDAWDVARRIVRRSADPAGADLTRVRESLLRWSFVSAWAQLMPQTYADRPEVYLDELAAEGVSPDTILVPPPRLRLPSAPGPRGGLPQSLGQLVPAPVGSPAARSVAKRARGKGRVAVDLQDEVAKVFAHLKSDKRIVVSVGPAFRPRDGNGTLGWLDYELAFSMADPLALRLYALLAAEVARGMDGGAGYLQMETGWLRNALGMPEERPARTRSRIARAADVLKDRGIVGSWGPVAGGHFHRFALGPVLQVVKLMENVSAEALRDQRTRLALLARCGLSAQAAESVIARHGDRVNEAILYTLWAMREGKTHTPAKWLLDACREGWRATSRAYTEWRQRVQRDAARLLPPMETIAVAPTAGEASVTPDTRAADGATPAAPAPQAMDACPFPDPEPFASEVWGIVREALWPEDVDPRTLPMREMVLRTHLPHLTAARTEAGILWCVYASRYLDVFDSPAATAVLERASRLVTQLTNGSVQTVRLVALEQLEATLAEVRAATAP